MLNARSLIAIAAALPVLAGTPLLARQDDADAIQRAAQYLVQQRGGPQAGEAALAGLALVKSNHPANDPGVLLCLGRVDPLFNSSTYKPQRTSPGGPSIYEAAVIAMFYVNLDAQAYRDRIQLLADYLVANQLASGAWDYNTRQAGDTSISQYAVLGLWEAANAGIAVHPSVWDEAARWYIRTQHEDGGWRYHPDEAGVDTISMTAAGVGSLLICGRQLEPFRAPTTRVSALLTPIVTDASGTSDFKPTVSQAELDAAIGRGSGWVAARFRVDQPVMGQSAYYGLYGIERIGALAQRETLGGLDWFDRGRRFILSSQQPGGNWTAQHGDVPNTAWAILFLTRSTAKSIRRIEIERLGGGTLVGGRGLPTDLTSLTIAGGKVMARPMGGAIEGILNELEDPRSDEPEAALAGLLARFRAEGPDVLRPHASRFRDWLERDPDPGVRNLAAWALGRLDDLQFADALIQAIDEDNDAAVVAQAADSLRLLSRKLAGLGPPPGADSATRKAAAKRWQQWLDAARTQSFDAAGSVP